MGRIQLTYDGEQHCTALKESHGKTVALDCPHTGKGEEFSPGELVGTSLAGCMFLSLGAVAQRNKLDINGARVAVEVSMTEKRIGTIGLVFTMQARPDSRRIPGFFVAIFSVVTQFDMCPVGGYNCRMEFLVRTRSLEGNESCSTTTSDDGWR